MLENFYNLTLTHNRNYFVRKILSVRVFLNFLKDAPFGAKNKHFPLLSHPLGFLKLRGKKCGMGRLYPVGKHSLDDLINNPDCNNIIQEGHSASLSTSLVITVLRTSCLISNAEEFLTKIA